jgi:gliding motility-associated-like protein
LVDTWYKAYFTNSLGCRSLDSVFIDVLPNYEVFVPTAFSPNEDGRNDVLYVRGVFIEQCNFAIYNRWGQKIFESPYLVYGWDGKSNYGDCDTGVYTWIAEGTFKDGTTFTKKGNVTLVR